MAATVIAVCSGEMALNIWIRATLSIKTCTKGRYNSGGGGHLYPAPGILTGDIRVAKHVYDTIKDVNAL